MRVKHLIEELQRRDPEAQLCVEITSRTVGEFKRLNPYELCVAGTECHGDIAAIEPRGASEFDLKIVLSKLV